MAGDYDAGEDEGGDELPGPAASAARTAPAALLLDVSTRRHVLQADGTFQALHPVDAAVINALFIARGKLRLAPGLGNRFREIRSPYDPRAQAVATDMVREALADEIRAGLVTVVQVRVEARSANAIEIAVDYFNERLLPREQQTRTSSR